MTGVSEAYVIDHLADHLRDWRMEPCDHGGPADEQCCSPCLRDRLTAALPHMGPGDLDVTVTTRDPSALEPTFVSIKRGGVPLALGYLVPTANEATRYVGVWTERDAALDRATRAETALAALVAGVRELAEGFKAHHDKCVDGHACDCAVASDTVANKLRALLPAVDAGEEGE